MPSKYSPYSVEEAQPPKFQPHEEQAASAFAGMALLLVVEVNVEILRLFKVRKGLYFWSMWIAILGCGIDSIGVILKFLSQDTTRIWPLYTLFLLSGWSLYAVLQLIILYSRLHLVNQSHKIQRFVLILTLATIPAFVIPTWIVVWPAYDPDPEVTHRWSPPDAIVERITQLGFTMVECIISGIYIYSLLQLLKYKSTVRQRRVFYDLIYVNIITVAFDVITVVLVYLNQLGISHPVQAFSYALKLRLEFVVLNQLMAVAARGIRRETFEEKRYHHPSAGEDSSAWDTNVFNEKLSDGLKGSPQSTDTDKTQKGSTQIAMPAPVLEAAAARSKSGQLASKDSTNPFQSVSAHSEGSTDERGHDSFMRALLRTVHPHSNQNGGKHKDLLEDDEEDEIGLHMWENHGNVVLEVPWFRKSTGAV